MALVDGPKYAGPLQIDLTDVKDDLIDLPPGAMRGLRASQEGIGKVIAELAQAIPTYGDAVGIHPQVYQRFLARTQSIALLTGHENELEKALEVCRETRAKAENDREDDISIMARTPQETAKRMKDPSIAAPFENTIEYNGRIAEKGQQTRRKNAEASQSAPEQGAGQAQPAQGG